MGASLGVLSDEKRKGREEGEGGIGVLASSSNMQPPGAYTCYGAVYNNANARVFVK